MGECMSCGRPVGGLNYHFTCPDCEGVSVMKDIRGGMKGQEAAMEMIASGLGQVADKVSDGFSQVADRLSDISDDLSTLAGIVQGGFEELGWELQQQTQILVSIDDTLKSPSQTQAREWRQMAEQLRKRGCFDEAEERFLKSLHTNPLDFRTYLGLAFNYLRKNDFDKAEDILTRSIPHAPKGCIGQAIGKICIGKICTGKVVSIREFGAFIELNPGQDGLCHVSELSDSYVQSVDEVVKLGDIVRVKVIAIDEKGRVKLSRRLAMADDKRSGDFGKKGRSEFDYRSLSHRLIGRIYACRGDFKRATSELHSALELSPNYPEGYYDHALYIVQSGTTSGWEESLLRAISVRPGYFNVARVERRFAPARQQLNRLLSGLLNEAYRKASAAIQDAEAKLAEAQDADAAKWKLPINEPAALLTTAQSDFATKDYSRLLKASGDATRAGELSLTIAEEARQAATASAQENRKRLGDALEEKRRRHGKAILEVFKMLGITIILCIVLAIVCSIGGCVAGVFAHGEGTTGRYANGGFSLGCLLGVIIGAIWGIRNVRCALDGEDPW